MTSDATSGGETDVSTNRRKQNQARKLKIQGLKEKLPEKIFNIEVQNSAEVDSARKTIWSDITKNNSAPKINRQTVIQKEENKFIRIVAVDEETYSALKSITEERSDIQLQPSKRPMVMIYDIDKELSPEEIATNIISQNTGMGRMLGEAAINIIRPLFKRGLRDRETVWLVCEVRPDIHAKLLTAGRVYIGMSNCRVSEYFDFQQCFTCLKYGHSEKFCKETTMTCTHWGAKEHKDTACNKKDDPPVCANCKGDHVAHSRFCRERRKAIDNIVRRTDYTDPSC